MNNSLRISTDDYRHFLEHGKLPTATVKAKRQDLEHLEQVAFFDALSLLKIPDIEHVHAVPNGSDRNAVVGGKLKAEGVKSGVLDIFWDVPRGPYHGFRAELKVKYANGRINKPSKAQFKWIEFYKRNGFFADWLVGWVALKDGLLSYYELGPFEASQNTGIRQPRKVTASATSNHMAVYKAILSAFNEHGDSLTLKELADYTHFNMAPLAAKLERMATRSPALVIKEKKKGQRIRWHVLPAGIELHNELNT